ncbi:MAG TPA: hypothetical protein PLO73_06885 [Spirochaetota bacterium]|nr:hypothetical protein [Spirochaetota bacterium]
MKRVLCFASLVLLIFISIPVVAQQNNFMISPPPIPWFEFKEGQKDLRVTATGMYITGDSTPPLTGDVKVWGAGAGGIYRYAFKDILAFDVGLMLVGATGDVGNEVDMSMWLASLPLDLEILLVNNDQISLIGFIGFGFSRNYIGIDSNLPGYEGTVDITTTMKGPQGGLQISFKLQDFTISPFVMITRQSGNVDMDYDIESEGSGSISVTAPTITSRYFGFDIVYVPLGLSLSSLMQQVSESGDNAGYKTYVINIGYCTQL